MSPPWRSPAILLAPASGSILSTRQITRSRSPPICPNTLATNCAVSSSSSTWRARRGKAPWRSVRARMPFVVSRFICAVENALIGEVAALREVTQTSRVRSPGRWPISETVAEDLRLQRAQALVDADDVRSPSLRSASAACTL